MSLCIKFNHKLSLYIIVFQVEGCDPILYGYRGLAVQWDFISGGYTVEDGHGLNPFSEEMINSYDDLHRQYCPYRKLVGSDVMQRHVNNIRYYSPLLLISFIERPVKLKPWNTDFRSIRSLVGPNSGANSVDTRRLMTSRPYKKLTFNRSLRYVTPTVLCWLFSVAEVVSKCYRSTFGRNTPLSQLPSYEVIDST